MAEPPRSLTVGVTVNLENFENLRVEVTGEGGSPEEAARLIAFLDGVLATMGRGDRVTALKIDHYRDRLFHPAADKLTVAARDLERRAAKSTEPMAGSPLPDTAPGAGKSGPRMTHAFARVGLAGLPPSDQGLAGTGIDESRPPAGDTSPDASPEEAVSTDRSLDVDILRPQTPSDPLLTIGPEKTVSPSGPVPGVGKDISLSPHARERPQTGEEDRAVTGEPVVAQKGGGGPCVPASAPETGCEACGAPVTATERKMSQLFTSKTLCRRCMPRA